jgi:iron(III) transport system ATP-binding protein
VNVPAVKLSEISRGYGPVRAVRSLSLTVERGEILALLGPSGCGKTTTLRLIAGFEPPEEGEISVSGNKVAGGKTSVPPEKRRVGMVFQDYALFPHLSVAGNVGYGIRDGKKRANRVAEVLRLARLDGLESRMPHELSGGQQQRVALARALAPEPAVVLLDEPFSNLDAALRARVRAEMRDILTAAGATAVFVTHDQEEAMSIADRVAVMFDGSIVQIDTPQEVYNRPATPGVARFVGEANFLRAIAEGDRLRCALGELEMAASGRGEVRVMLRPEALTLSDQGENGTPATVLGREFYGHDQLIRLRLDSGEEVLSRLWGTAGFQSGERVSVAARGPAVAFPASGDERK